MHNDGLEDAILRNSELLSEIHDAFCKNHLCLAQTAVTRSLSEAVRLVQMQLAKAQSAQRANDKNYL